MINFLTYEDRCIGLYRRHRYMIKWAVIGLVVVPVLCLFLGYSQLSQAWRTQQHLSELQKIAAPLHGRVSHYEKSLKIWQSQRKRAEVLNQGRLLAITDAATDSRSLTDGSIVLDSVRFTDKEVTIEGRGASQAAVTTYEQRLQSALKGVKLHDKQGMAGATDRSKIPSNTVAFSIVGSYGKIGIATKENPARK